MIAKPTTEQILNGCSRELMEVVLPAVSDETVKVTIMMMDLVLRNAAVRAAHEIAWMTDEIADLATFARSSSAPSGGADASEAGPPSLHLDDVVERYRQASETFSGAMDAAVVAHDDESIRRGRAILERRVEHEQTVMCGWSPVGR